MKQSTKSLIADLYEQGLDAEDIAERLECSVELIDAILEEYLLDDLMFEFEDYDDE